MESILRALCALLSLICNVLAVPTPSEAFQMHNYSIEEDGNNFTVFHHRATASRLKYVTNSKICETTPGVNQYSGYLSVGPNMNMWFWFFEARTSPRTAPLATWFNGGPGCSSMIGLFQENGPCHFVNGDSEPTLNPNSFSNVANMLFIDQPIGTGFSYGDDQVSSTATAAPFVWKFLQALYANFPQYENRNFGIFTESYGGHYGPSFANYFSTKNAQITSSHIKGTKINLIALGINNGWFDASLQQKSNIDFALNNSYKALITASQATELTNAYTTSCLPALKKCYLGNNDECRYAGNVCYAEVEGPLLTPRSRGGVSAYDFSVYDIRAPSNSPTPPEKYVDYLHRLDVMKAIGAKSTYQECARAANTKFGVTGDSSRSFLPQLSEVVKQGVQTLIWAGDADFICNWKGNLAVAEVVDFDGAEEFRTKELEKYTVKGEHVGDFKQVGTYSFLKVFNAGHEVPYYAPEAALQVFGQIMRKRPLRST